MTAPPDSGLVAPLRSPIEPLVHAPDAVESARVRGIRVIDDAVFEHERTQARPLARVRGDIGSSHGRDLGDRPFALLGQCVADALQRPGGLAAIVVFNAALALLLLGER